MTRRWHAGDGDRAVKARPLPCFGPHCRNTRPAWFFFCNACWDAIPGWLRRAIAREQDNCRASHTKHTQELLKLRDRAYSELVLRRAKREAQ